MNQYFLLIKLRSSQTLFLLSTLLLPLLLEAQSPAPGGVSAPKRWYASERTSSGEIIWKNRLPDQTTDHVPIATATSQEGRLNFNPAFPFDGNTKGITLPLPDLNLDKWTLFTVYQARDTFTEKSIWSYTQAGKTRGILTTHRMADLQQFEYLNFPEGAWKAPTISTYLHYQQPEKDAGGGPANLILAEPPRDFQLPISAFTGQLAELILYERVLAPEERQRVESYLAVKYGTMLMPDQVVSYLDAGGRPLYATTGDYTHRVTGIGRDDRSGLYQKQSTSSYAPGLLTLSTGTQATDNTANTHSIPDRHYLLWSDNNAPLDWEEKQILQARTLQRRWQVKATGTWHQTATELRFDTKRLPVPAAPGETYWLLIDRSGQGAFNNTGTLDYYPLTFLEASGEAVFQEIRWDTDGSGSDVFTIAGGPELTVRAQLQAPGCFPERTGSITVQALGGRPAYRFQLRKEQSVFRQWTSQGGELEELTGLPAGNYELVLTDADQRTYRESFFFQSADAPLISLDRRYQLPPEGRLLLDAGTGATKELYYEWLGPNGKISNRPALEITQPGIYQLQIDHQGCIARQNITVEPAPTGNFRRVELFPNPSSDGHFQLRVHLRHPADLHIKVFDPNGRQVQEQRQSSSNYYHHTGRRLAGSGAYLIQLQSQNDQLTLPLIVQ